MNFSNKNDVFSPLKRGDSWKVLFTFWKNSLREERMDFSDVISSRINLRDSKQILIAEPDTISINQFDASVFCSFNTNQTKFFDPGKNYFLDVEITFSDGKVVSTKDWILPIKIDRTLIEESLWNGVFTSGGLAVTTVDGEKVRVYG